MTTTRTPGWRTLNAYVDRELPAREAADVANAAACDSEIADQIALLHHVKGGIHDAFPAAPPDLAAVLPPQRRKPYRFVAAALVAAVALCAAFVAMPQTGRQQQHPTLFASARALHDQWLVQEVAENVDTPPVVLAALSRFGRLPVVPDLESTGLSVGLVSVSDLEAGRVLQIGYRGQHGCHLSLFVFSDREIPVPDVGLLDQLERAAAWQVNDLGYLLFAKGMDAGRFALIATEVEHATRVRAPLDDHARQLLAENKRTSTSCAS